MAPTGRRTLGTVSTSLIRLLVTAWVLVALGRAARGAWHHRHVAVTVWRRIRARHVLGALALLLGVLAVAATLLETVPATRIGLGSLIDFSGNAVFAPLETAARSTPTASGDPRWLLAVVATLFLGLLALLLPWLAFVEEEVFRAGLEHASPTRQAVVALVFGAVHLVMLVPVAAALSIALVGLLYGWIYRRAYARADGRSLPAAVARAYRPTRRAERAAARSRAAAAELAGDRSAAVRIDRIPERRQTEAVLASTVWHTTFNTMVVILVWLTLVTAALSGAGP